MQIELARPPAGRRYLTPAGQHLETGRSRLRVFAGALRGRRAQPPRRPQRVERTLELEPGTPAVARGRGRKLGRRRLAARQVALVLRLLLGGHRSHLQLRTAGSPGALRAARCEATAEAATSASPEGPQGPELRECTAQHGGEGSGQQDDGEIRGSELLLRLGVPSRSHLPGAARRERRRARRATPRRAWPRHRCRAPRAQPPRRRSPRGRSRAPLRALSGPPRRRPPAEGRAHARRPGGARTGAPGARLRGRRARRGPLRRRRVRAAQDGDRGRRDPARSRSPA